MWQIKRQSKYSNVSKEYNGRYYHSKKEAAYAQELDLLKKAGEIKDWKPQHKVSLDVNGYHICNYFVDFKVIDKYGEEELHEVKGFETDLWRIKRKLLEALYPDTKYIVIK